jgi:hypothetical protein
MNGFAGDDSILHATFWMLAVLVAGTTLLMLGFVVVTRCLRWCSRSSAERIESRSHIRPQI